MSGNTAVGAAGACARAAPWGLPRARPGAPV